VVVLDFVGMSERQGSAGTFAEKSQSLKKPFRSSPLDVSDTAIKSSVHAMLYR
jgi:hypothetical protein